MSKLPNIINEYRCILPDCKALLFKGNLIHGSIEIKCRCGSMNKFEITPGSEPEGRDERKVNGASRHVSPSA